MVEDFNVTKDSSRTEKILGTMTGDYSGSLDNPQSRVEALLLKLNEKIKNGAGSAEGASEIKRVDSLPAKGEEGVIYSIKKQNPTSADDLYDEWYWNGEGYEHIGSSGVDLSQYVTKEDLEKLQLKDTNTTYQLEQDKDNKRKFSLTGSDGTIQDVEIPDDSASAFVYDPNTETVSIEQIDPSDNNTGEPIKLSKVAVTGDYNDLANKPNVSEIEAGFVRYLPLFQKVDALPGSGAPNVVYLVSKGSAFDLYKWDASKGEFQSIGSTTADYTLYSRYNASILFACNMVLN